MPLAPALLSMTTGCLVSFGDGLAQCAGELVGGAACGKGHHKGDGLGRVGRRLRQCSRGHQSTERQHGCGGQGVATGAVDRRMGRRVIHVVSWFS